MPLVFDPTARRIVLDVASVTAAELWSRWSDWAASADNAKYLPAFRQAGGDDLGGGLSIPAYMFLLNGWRVRPMEASHTLIVTGNLFVDGGGVPVVSTLGAFNVATQYTVPVQAQAVSTGGGGASAAAIAAAVRLEIAAELAQMREVALLHGLVVGSPMVVSPTSRSAGGVVQSFAQSGDAVTVTRNA